MEKEAKKTLVDFSPRSEMTQKRINLNELASRFAVVIIFNQTFIARFTSAQVKFYCS